MTEGRGWFELGDGRRDLLFSQTPGAVVRESTVHVDGAEHPITVLTGAALYIQLPSVTVAALCGDVALSTLLMRARVGRVRKNRSLGLDALPDRMWLQRDGGPVLIWRRSVGPGGEAFFRVGPLSEASMTIVDEWQLAEVYFLAADDFLPAASWHHLGDLAAQRRAFGARVPCAADMVRG